MIEVQHLTKTVEFVRDEDADGSAGADSTTYRVNGEDSDSTSVEDILTTIEDMSSEGEADGSPQGEEFEISFTFHRNTSTFTEMTLGFTLYDNNFYLVSFDGEERLLVNRNDVANLEELFEAL